MDYVKGVNKKIISYNIQKKSAVNRPRITIVHRAEALENNDDYCSTDCGRWLNTDRYIVTTAPVTCARCLYVIKEKEIDENE